MRGLYVYVSCVACCLVIDWLAYTITAGPLGFNCYRSIPLSRVVVQLLVCLIPVDCIGLYSGLRNRDVMIGTYL